jgi:hypothetical protein
VRLIDGTKIICGMSRETVKRSDLFGCCGYGYDKSHSTYYWGMKLMLVMTPDGLVTGFILVNPKMYGELDATRMMLQVRDNRPLPGSTFVGDKGFRGREFEAERSCWSRASSWCARPAVTRRIPVCFRSGCVSRLRR